MRFIDGGHSSTTKSKQPLLPQKLVRLSLLPFTLDLDAALQQFSLFDVFLDLSYVHSRVSILKLDEESFLVL